MIRHHFERIIEAPRDVVYCILRDRQVELNESLPNIKSCRIVENCSDDGCRRKMVAEMRGRGLVPFMLSPFLNSDQLIWSSHQLWDEKDWSCDFFVVAHYYKDALDVRGRWTFEEAPAGTRISIKSRIEIEAGRIPGMPKQVAKPVSSFVEHILHAMTEPNLNKIMWRLNAMVLDGGAPLGEVVA
jgi:hypothetical protein